MSDFFYRQAKVSVPDGGRIRNNAYVTVSAPGGSLPIGLKDFKSTYDPNGTGRPAPILKSVKVTLKGTAGSLRECEVSYTCFDLASFEKLEKAFLKPSATVTIKYGYVGPETPGGSGSHKFEVFDFSFSITKENYFDCTFKGMGKGGTYEEEELNAAGVFPKNTFVTNYDWGNKTAKSVNLFDYLDWAVQDATGTTNSSGFDPGHGKGGSLAGGGHYGVLKAPKGYNPPTKLEGGVGTAYYIQYYTLDAIVKIINKYVTGKIKPSGYTIKFDPKFSNVQCSFPSGKVFSADPIAMLFPYSSGKENSYPDEKGGGGASDDYITCDSFSGVPRMSGTSDSPGKILLSRDLMRSIQNAVTNEAAGESSKTAEENKTKGGLSIRRFFNKIFASIRENSGGAWDLYLDQDEAATKNNTIYIVNRRAPTKGSVTPVNIDSVVGRNGIRELSLQAKVPNSVRAKAAGGAPGVSSEEGAAAGAINGDGQPPQDPPKGVADSADEARYKLHEGRYEAQQVGAAKSALKALVNELSPAERAARGQFNDGTSTEQVPYPIEFSCTMDGVEGWKFGDTVSATYLPSRYKSKSGGVKVVFTITEYEHAIEGNDWTTTITALMRMRP